MAAAGEQAPPPEAQAPPPEVQASVAPVVQPHLAPQPVEQQPLRRSTRPRKPALPDCYETYLGEDLYDVGKINDPATFRDAVESENSTKWIEAMEEELKSMSSNQVWDLIEIPDGVKTVGCKWVYKTKCDSKEKIERFESRLELKGLHRRK